MITRPGLTLARTQTIDVTTLADETLAALVADDGVPDGLREVAEGEIDDRAKADGGEVKAGSKDLLVKNAEKRASRSRRPVTLDEEDVERLSGKADARLLKASHRHPANALVRNAERRAAAAKAAYRDAR